ncbi:hypothetical protein EON62_02650, partial [archaeon]
MPQPFRLSSSRAKSPILNSASASRGRNVAADAPALLVDIFPRASARELEVRNQVRAALRRRLVMAGLVGEVEMPTSASTSPTASAIGESTSGDAGRRSSVAGPQDPIAAERAALDRVSIEALLSAFDRYDNSGPPDVISPYDFSCGLASLGVDLSPSVISGVLGVLGAIRTNGVAYKHFIRFVALPLSAYDLVRIATTAASASLPTSSGKNSREPPRARLASPARALGSVTAAVGTISDARAKAATDQHDAVDTSSAPGGSRALPASTTPTSIVARSSGMDAAQRVARTSLSSPRPRSSSKVNDATASSLAREAGALLSYSVATPWDLAPDVPQVRRRRPKYSAALPLRLESPSSPFWSAVNALEADVMSEVRRRATVTGSSIEPTAHLTPSARYGLTSLQETSGAFILRRAFAFFDRSDATAISLQDFHMTLAELGLIDPPNRPFSDDALAARRSGVLASDGTQAVAIHGADPVQAGA